MGFIAEKDLLISTIKLMLVFKDFAHEWTLCPEYRGGLPNYSSQDIPQLQSMLFKKVNFYCISSDFSDLPDMTDEYI